MSSKVLLGDIVSLEDDKRQPLSSRQREGRKGSYPYYGAQGIVDYLDDYTYDGMYLLVAEDGENLRSRKLPLANLVTGKFRVNNHAHVLAGTEACNIRLLGWMLNSMNLSAYITGSTQPKLNQKNLLAIELNLPTPEQQRAILAVLGSIEDMIHINNRINDYLAELCDVVFAERFGSIADNATLADIAEITMGQSPSGKSYNEEGQGAVFYQGRGEFGWRYPSQRLFTTEPKRMAQKGDVLMSVRAPVGDLNVAYEDCCIGRGLAAIHSQYPSFCLYLMRSLRQRLNAYNGEGTVFGSINGKALNGLAIGLPAINDIADFEGFANAIDQQILSNVTEERNLAALRDALLPRLMSGEIDVSEIELSTQPNNHLS